MQNSLCASESRATAFSAENVQLVSSAMFSPFHSPWLLLHGAGHLGSRWVPPQTTSPCRGAEGHIRTGGKKKNKQKRSELKPIKSTGKMQGGRLSLPELEFGLGAMEMKPGRWLRCTREARVQHLTLDS